MVAADGAIGIVKLARLLGVAGLVAVLVAGCGRATEARKSVPVSKPAKQRIAHPHPESRKVRAAWIALDGWEGAETLGLVMAERYGLFHRSHLLVTTLAPATPALSIPDVLNGSDLIGVAHAPQAVIARAKGAPIVVIGSLVSQPTAAMIWLAKSNIETIADLKGKTIAIPGLSFQRDFLERVLSRGGLTLEDVNVIKVGDDLIPALVKGRADAIFGGSGNLDGADLQARGLEPVITPVKDLGIPAYEELVLVAREDQALEYPELMHDFTTAVSDGAAGAVHDPKQAIAALRGAGERNPEIGKKGRVAEVRKTVPLLSKSGHVSPVEMKRLIDWMYEREIIPSQVSVPELLAQPGADGQPE